MAHPRHQAIRQRYEQCCGYCGVSETATGGELTVDHHQPVTAGGSEDDDNLVYCCFRCNTFKGEFHPNEDDIRNQRRVLHPLHDSVRLHIRENEQTGVLEALTATGRFHVFLLRLNRPQLVEYRCRRRLARDLENTCRLLRDENEMLRSRITELENYNQQLDGQWH